MRYAGQAQECRPVQGSSPGHAKASYASLGRQWLEWSPHPVLTHRGGPADILHYCVLHVCTFEGVRLKADRADRQTSRPALPSYRIP